jgi:hypothetical protein
MLWMRLVESCECFPRCGVLSNASRRLGIYMKTVTMKILLPLSRRKEEKFRTILREIGVECRLDSSERWQYPARSIHEPVLTVGFNRSSKFLCQIERGCLFVQCRKIRAIWFPHGRHCPSLLHAMWRSLVMQITQITTSAGLMSSLFFGIIRTFQNFSVSLSKWFPETSRLYLLQKRLYIETTT